jgi:hypothetical protein
MKKQLWVLMALVLFLSGMNLALAQKSTTLSFSVSFPFKAGDKNFSAGSYRIVYDGRDSRHVQLVDVKTNQKQFISFITRLSSRSEGGVIFDSINKVRYLSEVYIEGTDGFQIRATPDDHSHENADAGNSKQ